MGGACAGCDAARSSVAVFLRLTACCCCWATDVVGEILPSGGLCEERLDSSEPWPVYSLSTEPTEFLSYPIVFSIISFPPVMGWLLPVFISTFIFARRGERPKCWFGVAEIISKTRDQWLEMGRDRRVRLARPSLINNFGCGSWALAPWQQHQESGRCGGSEDGGFALLGSATMA